jgi:hypothetical protein
MYIVSSRYDKNFKRFSKCKLEISFLSYLKKKIVNIFEVHLDNTTNLACVICEVVLHCKID